MDDILSKQYQIDLILDGLLEEYNPFIIQMYGTSEPRPLYDVEAFIYVQEAQLNKF